VTVKRAFEEYYLDQLGSTITVTMKMVDANGQETNDVLQRKKNVFDIALDKMIVGRSS
jgi:hypothetical protein